jgi:hypothetical protein
MVVVAATLATAIPEIDWPFGALCVSLNVSS